MTADTDISSSAGPVKTFSPAVVAGAKAAETERERYEILLFFRAPYVWDKQDEVCAFGGDFLPTEAECQAWIDCRAFSAGRDAYDHAITQTGGENV